MLPEHVETFLNSSNHPRVLGGPSERSSKPLQGLSSEDVRRHAPESIVALSALYALRTPFPEGTRLTSQGAYFSTEAAALDYLERLSPPGWGQTRVRKLGKSWRIQRKDRGGWVTPRL